MPWLRGKLAWLLLIASLAFNAGVVITFVVLAYNQHSAEPRHPKRGPRSGDLLEKLNLTADRASQTEAAEKKMKERIRELRDELRKEYEALSELMVAAEPDRAAVTTQLEKMASLRGQMQHQVVWFFLDLKEMLDSEQRKAFDARIRNELFSHGRGGHKLGSPRGSHRKGGPMTKPGRPDGGNDK